MRERATPHCLGRLSFALIAASITASAARYDGERTAASFAERRRDQVDLAELEADIAGTVGLALRPRSFGLWIRPGRGGAA
jgi:hypothetical protein